jgi:uncharacterized surface anchored protein
MLKFATQSTQRKTHLTTLTMMLCVGLISTAAMADTGTLEGLVTDMDTALPIEGALVIARGGNGMPPGRGPGGGGGHGLRFAFTEADGTYTIEDLAVGDYTVFCGKHGYSRADAATTIVVGQTTTLDFALEPLAYGSVEGSVTDAQTGNPIAGAHVRLFRPWFDTKSQPDGKNGGDRWWLHAITGADGSYLIDNVPAGDYNARATASGFFPSDPVAVTVEDGQTAVVNFNLDPLAFGTVQGIVTDDATGVPIAGAHVVLMRPWNGGGRTPDGENGDGWWLHAITGADGSYLIENAPAGDYDARATAYGYQPSDPVPVTVTDGGTETVDFALVPLTFGSIEGTVTDADTGDAIEHAFVHLRRQNGPGDGGGPGGGWHWAMTDENGFYSLDEVPIGSWQLRVFAWGYLPAEATVEVLQDQTTVLDFQLDPWGGGGHRVVK